MIFRDVSEVRAQDELAGQDLSFEITWLQSQCYFSLLSHGGNISP